MDEHEKLIQTIPYIAFESAQARNERVVKRLILALIITISMLFVSNMVWIHEWMSYDYIEEDGEEITVDAGERGNANFIGNDGSIVNGEDNR